MFPQPLEIVVGASKQFRLLLTAVHITAASGLLLTALPDAVRAGLLFVIGANLAWQMRKRKPLRLRAGPEDKLHVWRGDAWQEVRLSGSSVVWPGLIGLNYTGVDQRHAQNWLILPDSMPASDFRRFRVWLRWRGSRCAAPLAIPGGRAQ